MISVEEFSGLLLELSRASRDLAMREFQAYAMARLRREFAFDSVIWAMETQMEDGRLIIHDLYSEGMPDDCCDLLNMCETKHLIATTCLSSTGTCFNFGPEQLHAGFREMMLGQRFGVMHALCTVSRSTIPQLLTFLALHRRDAASAFTEDERQLKQYLMPHLADMVQINRVMQIASLRANAPSSRTVLAMADEVGMLHAAEPGFGSLLHLEWPNWDGPILPKSALAALSAGRERYLGVSLVVDFQRVHEFTLVTVTRRTPADKLSPRERTVADTFANGESYKEVARHLGISPATVRHHLRVIYEKLGVTDKGELSKLLSGGST